MANKAKHAFGTLENIDTALSNGTIDSYDILFVKDANGKPYVGWIDKEGNKVICDDSAEFAELESAIASKVSADEVDAKIATKTDAVVEEKMTGKIDEAVESANAYTDAKIAEIESAVSYEIIEF